MLTHQIHVFDGQTRVHDIRSELFAFPEVLDVFVTGHADALIVVYWGRPRPAEWLRALREVGYEVASRRRIPAPAVKVDRGIPAPAVKVDHADLTQPTTSQAASPSEAASPSATEGTSRARPSIHPRRVWDRHRDVVESGFPATPAPAPR